MKGPYLRLTIVFVVVSLLAPIGLGADGVPTVLSAKDRFLTVNKITQTRLDRLLPQIMRETGFDMWILLCNEDNLDPVFRTMIPYNAWCPITQILVFYDPGSGKPIERLNLSRTNMYGLHRDAWDYRARTEDQWSCLARIVRERNPRKIGINESDVIWAADGLTVSLKKKLMNTLGPDFASRTHSAEPMSILWLETLIDEEVELFERAVAVSHALIAETFSSQVITPGVTTLDDLQWHYTQRALDLGLQVEATSFLLVRSPQAIEVLGKQDSVVRPGDLIECDVCLIYLQYHTDHHQWAYVLRPGEAEVPASFQAVLAEGNRLQEVYASEFRAGLSGNQLLAAILAKAKASSIPNPKIYSHSLGYYLHEPGPLIGLPWEQVNTGGRGEVRLVENSGFVAELSVGVPIPEWGGKVLRLALEEDLVFTSQGVHFLDGRQTAFHVVR